MPSRSDSAIAWPMAHSPVLSSDTSTVVAVPVFSRWKSAPMIPPAMVMAPSESPKPGLGGGGASSYRSEEHTSELQSLMRISYAVFCLKNKTNNSIDIGYEGKTG